MTPFKPHRQFLYICAIWHFLFSKTTGLDCISSELSFLKIDTHEQGCHIFVAYLLAFARLRSFVVYISAGTFIFHHLEDPDQSRVGILQMFGCATPGGQWGGDVHICLTRHHAAPAPTFLSPHQLHLPHRGFLLWNAQSARRLMSDTPLPPTLRCPPPDPHPPPSHPSITAGGLEGGKEALSQPSQGFSGDCFAPFPLHFPKCC